jgi:uncharacterized protein YdhG (YjbR/CyaY superfamily)
MMVSSLIGGKLQYALSCASNAGQTDENLTEIARVNRSYDCDLYSSGPRCATDDRRTKANLDKHGFGRTMVRMKKVSLGNRLAGLSTSSDAVDAYIAAVPEPAQTALVRLREIIRSAVPKDAVEVISYGIPAFKLSKPFFGYAAFKRHVSVLPFSGSLFNSFDEELKAYSRTKSSLHLPFDKPLPAALIRKLVRARVAAIPSSARRRSSKAASSKA